MQQLQHVLITGASSGIGRAIAELLNEKGYAVTGTSRHPETIKNPIPGVRYLRLDLQDPESIDLLAATVPDTDILINNAGQSQIGPLEEIPMEKIRSLFEVNYFGLVRLSKALIPAMRQRRSGAIINISSMSGVFGVAYTSQYCSSKFALEGFSRSLRQELAPFGIPVVLIEPGYIATGLQQEQLYSGTSEYFPRLSAFKTVRDRNIENGADPKIIARKVLKVLKSKNPKAAYPVGGDAALLAFFKRVLPARIAEYFQRKKFKSLNIRLIIH
ncbi:MAG: SDR family oxidoreductase [Candidatus Neomarinimicrobiota bacterium]|jgi:short-subunit dehydrogenase|nr:SDR family oxidoreductase [Candidatus Neomarinimicrobiota bacterium]MDD3966041.1 SDR family oxidoreductase [Candidatus Neomarinimicrobiota bacterium]MDX9780475.1 SDR family oxidoreductase [bacterium]